MKKTLDSYFSPKSQNKIVTPVKRTRSSPEIEKVTKRQQSSNSLEQLEKPPAIMNADQLEIFKRDILSAISALLDSKNYSTKEDIKCLEQQITQLKSENENLRKELADVKDRENERNDRMDYLENQLKSRNLIIKGIQENELSETEPMEWVNQFFTDILCINKNVKVLSARFIKMSNGKRYSVMITLEKTEDVYMVFQKTKMLRGTPYSVDRDLCYNSRQKRGKLLLLKKEVKRVNEAIPVTVRSDYIMIKSSKFYWNLSKGPINIRHENAVQNISEMVGCNMDSAVQKIVSGDLASYNTIHSKKMSHEEGRTDGVQNTKDSTTKGK